MNKKKEIDKLARLTILSNFVSSKLKEQKDLVKSFINEEDKVLKGIEHKLNVIVREYEDLIASLFVKNNQRSINLIRPNLLGRLNSNQSLTKKKKARFSQRISHFFKCKHSKDHFGARAFALVPSSILHFT